MTHGAGIILVRKDGAILMQHRDNKPNIVFPDHWCIVGGHVEPNENFEKAAKRELFEETGYKADEINLLVEDVYFTDKNQEVTRHVYWGYYDNKQLINCFEGQEIKFVALNDFAGKNFYPGHEELFKLAVQKSASQGVALRS